MVKRKDLTDDCVTRVTVRGKPEPNWISADESTREALVRQDNPQPRVSSAVHILKGDVKIEWSDGHGPSSRCPSCGAKRPK